MMTGSAANVPQGVLEDQVNKHESVNQKTQTHLQVQCHKIFEPSEYANASDSTTTHQPLEELAAGRLLRVSRARQWSLQDALPRDFQNIGSDHHSEPLAHTRKLNKPDVALSTNWCSPPSQANPRKRSKFGKALLLLLAWSANGFSCFYFLTRPRISISFFITP